MAIRKTNTYINAELDWAEEQLNQWRNYMDNNAIDGLTDRIVWKEMKGGLQAPQVVASVEAQGKYIQDMMKNYLSLLAEVNKMRVIEEEKKKARGSGVVPHRMR